MLSLLLPYRITIERTSYTTSGGEQQKSFSTVYSNIKCRYYRNRGKLTNTEVAVETKENTYSIIIEGNKQDVQKGDKATIDGVDRTFLIEDVKVQVLFDGQPANHVFLTAKQL